MNGPLFGTDTPAAAWRPSPAYLERSRLRRFLADVGCADLEALQARAVADPAWFWEAAARDIGVRFEPAPRSILDTSQGIEWARWFEGAGFNYVRMAVDEPAAARPDEMALVWEGEDGEVRHFTRAQLRWAVDRAARAIAALGVGRGDRVGIFLPMIPEAVIAVLAVGKLGAVYTPIFSGYGAEAVASRLADCGARLLVTADGFARRGKPVPMKATADEALAAAPSVERCLVVRRTGADVPWSPERDAWWDAAVTSASDEPLASAPTDANDPFMIIYTSGTTGRPKGAVHVHAGFPAEGGGGPGPRLRPAARRRALLVHRHGLDDGSLGGRRRTDARCHPLHLRGHARLPWAGSAVGAGGAAPDHAPGDQPHRGPRPDDARRASRPAPTTSPRWWRSARPASRGTPIRGGGSFDVVGGSRLPIINYSGGTEISGGILGCTTLAPIAPCSFSGPCPGMAADVVDAPACRCAARWESWSSASPGRA